MSFLLDTNVVSELRRRRPDAGVVAWFDTVDSRELYLSVLTIGEIRQGICRLHRRDPAQAAVFDRWLAGLLRAYSDRVVPVTVEVAQEWGRGRLNVPDPVPVVDGLLAATAKVHDWTLVTRDVGDVACTGARLLNPFTATP
ncbi:MAG: type II toxin-antitoxin system VapC family toxin [Actinomycetota bacterium]|nr:type II toxin-antitoxin system VapC family toxin [Actinomycetota bacterium]